MDNAPNCSRLFMMFLVMNKHQYLLLQFLQHFRRIVMNIDHNLFLSILKQKLYIFIS